MIQPAGSVLIFFLACSLGLTGQVPYTKELAWDDFHAPGTYQRWVEVAQDEMGRPIAVPVVVVKGSSDGPVLGLVAAIHGEELNGIPVIHQVLDSIDVTQLRGTLVAVPGLNPVGISNNDRNYGDGVDLNRVFPGKKNGDESQQFAYQMFQKIIRHVDVLIDLHTASFGRINTHYVRADMQNDTMAQLALLQHPDIIVDNAGLPSAGQATGDNRTLRAEAVLNGIPCITIELGNPQVFQSKMVNRGAAGVLNGMRWLGMIEGTVPAPIQPVIMCKKSYWLYVEQGGFLEVLPGLGTMVAKSEKIGILKNPFGAVVQEYFAPEAGVVIGKSSNPANKSGGRILHLGILK